MQPYIKRARELHIRSKQLAESLTKWENLAEQESLSLFDKAQATDLQAQSLAAQLERVVKVWPDRVQKLAAAGEMIASHSKKSSIVAKRENEQLWLIGKNHCCYN